MIVGEWKTALIDIDVDDDLSAEVNLGRPFEKLLIICPALTVSATVSIKVAEKTGGTFYDLHYWGRTKDETIATQKWVTTAYTTGVFATVCECLGGYQFIKVSLSASQTGSDVSFRVCGVRS